MKIYVLNLARNKAIKLCVIFLICISIVLSAVVGITMKIYGRSLISEMTNAALENKIIILDAGHGGEDPGAISENGVYEKDLNLAITLEIGRILCEEGYAVVYTRTDDRLLYKEEEDVKGIRKISDLKNRCNVAEKYPDALFVSIHMNSFGDRKYSGLQVYYSEKNDKSFALADKIQSKVKGDLQQSNNRKTKEGKNMYVLENINNVAVLIECGFMSNPEELKKLSEKEYQKELSFSIVCGIIEYISENNV